MPRGNVSPVPAEIVAARRAACKHHRPRLMQRGAHGLTYFLCFLPSCSIHEGYFVLIDMTDSAACNITRSTPSPCVGHLSLSLSSQLSALQPLAGPSAWLHLPLPIRSSRASPVWRPLLRVSQRWQAGLLFCRVSGQARIRAVSFWRILSRPNGTTATLATCVRRTAQSAYN